MIKINDAVARREKHQCEWTIEGEDLIVTCECGWGFLRRADKSPSMKAWEISKVHHSDRRKK